MLRLFNMTAPGWSIFLDWSTSFLWDWERATVGLQLVPGSWSKFTRFVLLQRGLTTSGFLPKDLSESDSVLSEFTVPGSWLVSMSLFSLGGEFGELWLLSWGAMTTRLGGIYVIFPSSEGFMCDSIPFGLGWGSLSKFPFIDCWQALLFSLANCEAISFARNGKVIEFVWRKVELVGVRRTPSGSESLPTSSESESVAEVLLAG